MSRTTLYSPTALTQELRELVENGVDIWDFEYDGFYEGDEKLAFEKKVIDHYYFRQIGQETVERFKHFFRCRIREIMPYYKQVYKSIKIMDEIKDPFGNVDVTETFEEERSESSTASSNSSSSSDTSLVSHEAKEHIISDAPRGAISNIQSYMTNAETEDNDSSGTTSSDASAQGTSSGESNGTVKHTFRKTGNQGVNTYAHDMVEYRQTFLNIDKMVIDDLNDLFLGVY